MKEVGPHLPRFAAAQAPPWVSGVTVDEAFGYGSAGREFFVLILAMSELNTHLYLSCQPVPFSNFVLMWKEQIKCGGKKSLSAFNQYLCPCSLVV